MRDLLKYFIISLVFIVGSVNYLFAQSPSDSDRIFVRFAPIATGGTPPFDEALVNLTLNINGQSRSFSTFEGEQTYTFSSLPGTFRVRGSFEFCLTDGSAILCEATFPQTFSDTFDFNETFSSSGCREKIVDLNPGTGDPLVSMFFNYVANRLPNPSISGGMGGNVCGSTNLSISSFEAVNATLFGDNFIWEISNNASSGYREIDRTTTASLNVSLSDIEALGFSEGQSLFVRVASNDECENSRVSNPSSITFLPPGPNITLTPSPPICPGGNSSMTLTASGAGPYSYSVRNLDNNQTGNSRANFSGTTTISTATVDNGLTIVPGTYRVTVESTAAGTNCPSSRTVTISDAPALGVAPRTPSPTGCVGGDNGSVVIDVTDVRMGSVIYDVLQGGSIFDGMENEATGLSGDGNFTISGLPAGMYSVRISDGCGDGNTSSAPFEIVDGSALTLTGTPAPPSCLVGTDRPNGSIVARTNTVGTADYTYVLSGDKDMTMTGGREVTFDELSPGTYNIQVTSDEGCIANDMDIEVEDPPGDFSIDFDNAPTEICLDGTFDLKVDVTQDANVDDNYTYQLFDVSGLTDVMERPDETTTATTFTFMDLSAGEYRVDVTDNCRDAAVEDELLSVTEFDEVELGTISFDNGEFFDDATPVPQTYQARCFGDEIIVRIPVTGGEGDHVITFNGVTENKDNGIPSATFPVTLTTAEETFNYSIDNTCLASPITGSLTLRQAPSLFQLTSATPLVKNDGTSDVAGIHITCPGDSDGEIEVVVSGGLAPYDYRLFGSSSTLALDQNLDESATSHTFPGLSAGTYTVEVTDILGCFRASLDITLVEATSVSFDLSTNFLETEGGIDYHFRCKDDVATLTAAISGATASLYPLRAELFDVTNNVSLQTVAATNPGDPAIFSNINQSDPTVVYRVDIFDRLCLVRATTDIITLREAAEAFNLDSLDVEEVIKDIRLPYHVSCVDGDDGEISVEVSGGVSPYTYRLTSDQPSIAGRSDEITGTTHVFSNLRATLPGNDLTPITYSVEVIDALGCEQPTVNNLRLLEPTIIAATPPVLPDENGFNVRCNGFTIDIEIPISGGAVRDINDYIVTLSNSSSMLSPNSRGTDRVFYEDLPADNYTVIIQDLFGTLCQLSVDPFFEITEPPVLTISEVTSSNQSPLCIGHATGTFEVQAAGGVFTNAIPGENYEFEIISAVLARDILTNDPVSRDFDMTPVITGSQAVFTVPAGDFTIMVTDRNGCGEEVMVTVEETANPLTIALDPADVATPSCFGGNDGSIIVSATGGNPFPDPGDGSGFGYRFELTGADLTGTVTLFSNNLSSVTFENLVATINPFGSDLDQYKIFVSDLNGCVEVPTSPTNVAFTDIGTPSLITLNAEVRDQPTCFNGTDGVLSVRANGGVAPYQFSTDGVVFASSPDGNILNLVGLEGDSTYTIYVRDARFDPLQPVCTISSDFFLPAGPRLEISATPSPVTCTGGNDGSIEAFVRFSGSQDPSLNVNSDDDPGEFTYEWRIAGSSTVFSTDKDISGRTAGSYQVTIRRNGQPCIGVATVTVTQPDEPLSFQNFEAFDASCANKNDGFVTLIIQGGSTLARASLEYSLNGGAFETLNGNVIDELSAGGYSLLIRNADGCTTDTTFTIEELSPILEIQDQGNVTCFGGNNGFVVLSVSPALEGRVLQDIEYGIDDLSNGTGGIVFQSSPAFLNLAAGDYDFYVQESSNTSCSTRLTETVTITQPSNADSDVSCNPVIAVIGTTVDETCDNSADGRLTVNVSGGVEPYTFSWSHDNLLNSPQADNLTAGDYTVTVTDAADAIAMASGTVGVLSQIVILATTIDDVDCFGGNDGSVNLLVTGGSGSYLFNWSDGQTTSEAVNLIAGDYSVTVTDALNSSCEVSTSVTVEQPDEITAAVINAIPTTCDNTTDGELTISVSGGSGLFDIVWPDGQMGPTARNLVAGTYDVMITDRVGNCVFVFMAVLPETPAVRIVSSTLISPTCFGFSNGSISIVLENARNPFIQWRDENMNDVAIGPTVQGLAAGSYSVEIIDADGCTITDSFLLTEPDVLEITSLVATSTACNEECNGVLEAQVIGGTLPYTFSWLREGVVIESGIDLSRIDGLCAGTYTLTVEDGNGCTISSITTVNQPDPISITDITRNMPSCNGFDDGSIEIVLEGGTAPYNILWPDGTTGPVLSGITSGTYLVNITDQNGCEFEEVIELQQPDQIQLSGFNLNEPLCTGDSNGSIEVTIVGGTQPYEYLWSNGQTTQTATLLPSGVHTLIVTDSNDCTFETEFTLGQPAGISVANVVVSDPTCFGDANGSISFGTIGGTGVYTYDWSNGSTTEDIDDLVAGSYSVTITDSNGCSTSSSFTLIDPDEVFIATIPNVVVLCEGSSTQLTAGEGWVNYSWSRNNNVFSDQQEVTVNLAGSYNLMVETAEGCVAVKDFVVEIGTNIITADFIFDSEITAGDTVIIVDVSWPLPDRVVWNFPDGVQVLTDSSAFYQEIIFDSPGEFTISLNSQIDDCFDFIAKTITVLDPNDGGSGGRPGGRIGEKEENKLEVKVSPNPNDGAFRLIIEQDDPEDVKVMLFDFQNATPIEEMIIPAETVITLIYDKPDLHPGLYFMVVERGSKRKLVRFIVK